MNDILEQALLYDFYGELLTSHQKEIYEQFVLEDLSLSEIAGEAGISRQGVHDLIKRCQKALEGYEEAASGRKISFYQGEGSRDRQCAGCL